MKNIFLALFYSLFVATWCSAADQFPQPFNTGKAETGPMPADLAAKNFKLPPGMKAQVFVAEPEVNNPLAMTWDTQGRLWVAECFTYGDRATKFDLTLRDRVIILADRDGDGRAEERKVFTDHVQRLMSVEVGLGGVWLICLPQLLFIPDANGDDVPDGQPQVVLDGFETSTENYHNCANGLRWGLDGWLYGRCGASSPGWIGPPGTPREQRVPIYGGIWRYHPQRKVFETLCHGTTNPWGHDWDALGELFFVNTVTGHLFHMIPGAHYTRSSTITPNRRMYAPLNHHADHFHYDTGKPLKDKDGLGIHDSLGGGHAHSGAAIYLGDRWPQEFQGRLLTLNFHGRRINVERLPRHGSGFEAQHDPDIAFAADTWFRGIDALCGPDGQVYVADWSDTGECHEHDGVHRLSGRIFRIVAGKDTTPDVLPLTKRTPKELLALQTHPNEWLARHARRELANRAATGEDFSSLIPALKADCLNPQLSAQRRLRALWTWATLGTVEREVLLTLLEQKDESLRVWGVRMLTDRWPIDTVQGQPKAAETDLDATLLQVFQQLAADDPSALVRLVLASTVQRLPVGKRANLAAALMAHAEDAEDHNLPQLLWYGLAPLVDSDAKKVAELTVNCRWPLTREWMARGLAEEYPQTKAAVELMLSQSLTGDVKLRGDLVRGLTAGLAGKRKAEQPTDWKKFAESMASAEQKIQEQLRNLNVVFGDGRALEEVRRLALDNRAAVADRRAALETLIEARPPDLREVCERLLKVRFLNTTALGGLTLFDSPEIGQQLAQSYSSFHPSERASVIEALTSRPTFARALLDQMAVGKIPTTALSAYQARQIRSFDQKELSERLSSVWGALRDSPQEKQQLIDEWKQRLAPAVLASANASQGRAVFQTACANCHRLYGSGGAIGPDLTGAGRSNLDYLLSNMIDPSAVVNKDFRMSVVVLSDGRILNGILISQDKQRVVLQTIKERLTLPADEVDEISPTLLSPMPEGLLQPLQPDQVRDLISYLMTNAQVDFPSGYTPPTVPIGGGP